MIVQNCLIEGQKCILGCSEFHETKAVFKSILGTQDAKVRMWEREWCIWRENNDWGSPSVSAEPEGCFKNVVISLLKIKIKIMSDLIFSLG